MTGLALTTSSLMAQQFTTLVSFTNVWKYDQSGADFGTVWRTNDFDDSAWPSGQGLLGSEPDSPQVYTQHAPIRTPLTVSLAVTTFYFRTTFQFNGSMEGLKLFATNLIDDGCAIHLNGMLAGGVRLQPRFNATTTFQGPATEGQLDVVDLTNHLRVGANQLAVEVHQSAAMSADVMFGLKLVAVNETPLIITNQPQSLQVMLGEPAALSVGVDGGPVAYRWQRDGVNLPSTSNRLVIANAQLANSGNYRVICSNSLTVVTSSVATLSVLQDLSGPKVLEAIGDNGFGVRGVNVRFSETLNITTARNTSNYLVTHLDSGSIINVTNILYSQALGALLQLDESDPDWFPYGDYVLTINNVADSRNNLIAPNTRVPIGWIYVTNLVEGTVMWDFHDIAVFDPGIYDQPWYESTYVPGDWWGQGQGGFQGGPSLQFPCSYVAQPQIAMSYQPEPTLFRTSFQWPAHWSTNGILRLRYGADDGLVLYLNGVEIHRYNVAGVAGTPVSAASRAVVVYAQTVCITNVSLSVTNLVPGTNWIAAAVVQSVNDQPNSYFVFDMSGAKSLGPDIPFETQPVLQMNAVGSDRINLSWSGSGYALETSTNLALGPLSYPAGPWIEVPQMTNPFLWNITDGPQRFFRLRK